MAFLLLLLAAPGCSWLLLAAPGSTPSPLPLRAVIREPQSTAQRSAASTQFWMPFVGIVLHCDQTVWEATYVVSLCERTSQDRRCGERAPQKQQLNLRQNNKHIYKSRVIWDAPFQTSCCEDAPCANVSHMVSLSLGVSDATACNGRGIAK